MERSVTRWITIEEPEGSEPLLMAERDEEGRCLDMFNTFFGYKPREAYRVTYELDEGGEYTVRKVYPPGKIAAGSSLDRWHELIKKDLNWMGMRCYIVCFLPPEWAGMTVTRTVSPV